MATGFGKLRERERERLGEREMMKTKELYNGVVFVQILRTRVIIIMCLVH